ncbi:MAG: hypothetical protein IT569_09430 [Leptospiraceae bacterium]|nr:hypothetical protein [Leptospiraceae bacterium]
MSNSSQKKETQESKFKSKTFITIFVLILISFALGAIAYIDIFKPFAKSIDSGAQSVEVLLRSKILAGLSVGMIFLAIGAYLIPVILKDIDTKNYHKELRNGILSAGVFYLITLILEKADQKHYLKLALTIVVVSVIFLFLMNWILSKIDSKKTRTEIRTAIVGSIVSGILFSILVHFLTIGINYSKKKAEEVTPRAAEIQKKVGEIIPLPIEDSPKKAKSKPKNKK